MATHFRLKVPAYNLTWHETPSLSENDLSKYHLLLPGGGGSTKSGVKNQIMIGGYSDKGKVDVDFKDGFMTDTEKRSSLCSGVATGIMNGQPMAAAILDKYGVLYIIKEVISEKTNDVSLT